MFANLPEPIQQQILSYLEVDNFPAAKELRDMWLLWEGDDENEHD